MFGINAFWWLWGGAALVAAVILYFFLIGLADGSVSSFNAGLWTTILLVVGGILLGSLALRSGGHLGLAKGILWLLVGPGLLYGLFLIIILIANPRWN